MYNTKKIVIALTILSSTTSCSTRGPTVEEFNERVSPTVEVTRLDHDLQEAANNQVNVLSPKSFKQSQSALKDAQKSLAKEKPAREILHEVAVGRAYLDRSYTYSKVSHDNIEDVVLARKDAINAKAPQLLSKEFYDADENLMDVTEDIERNKLKDATKNRAKLQATYLELEMKAIKEENLRPARDAIKMAISEGAREYAPRTLISAQKKVVDADAYITANRHSDQVIIMGKESKNEADRLLKITRDSKTGKTSSEDMALLLESKEKNLSQTQEQLASNEGQLSAEQQKARLLSKEQNFNAHFEKAREEFSQDEAEIYRQGNSLVIRLRTLEFPSGKAVLKESNFPLLSKVQKVIQDFDASSIVVEGHTDSTGGKKANEKLSSHRAEAVKEYFISNSDAKTLDIKSIGYGYQKPLATNKTSQGRAQNRRVDVVIQADVPAKE